MEIKLYQIDSDDGSLGYVRHRYSPKNPYQKIGNFFIGVAPVLVISAILYILSQLLVPDMVELILSEAGALRFGAGIGDVFESVIFIATCFFGSAKTVYWWLFFAVSLFLAPHMTLSGADIQGAWSGLLTILIVLFGVDVALGVVQPSAMESLTDVCLTAGGVLCGLLVFSLAVTLLLVILSFLLRRIFRKFI